MNNAVRSVLAIIMISAGLIIGTKMGFDRAKEELRAAEGTWHRASLPEDQEAARFIDVDGPQVVVQSTEGEYYARPVYYRDDTGWQVKPEEELSAIPPDEGGYGGCVVGVPLSVPEELEESLPGEVAEHNSCGYSEHAEHNYRIHYILLEDGSIWRWDKEVSMASSIADLFLNVFSLIYPILYGAAGFAAGFGVFFFISGALWLGSNLRKGQEGREIIWKRIRPVLLALLVIAAIIGLCYLLFFLAIWVPIWWSTRGL
jgi:hypothetical protein